MAFKTSIKSGNFRPTKKGAGMTAMGVKAYRRANPGSKLKTAVTESKPSSPGRSKRRKAFCSRMCGMKKKRTSRKQQNNRNSRINQSLKRWRCRCGS